MEGLEISEINKNLLERTLRIDSEFYSKENLQVVEKLKSFSLNNISELVKVSDGNHMSISENFSDVGVPYYRGQDIHKYFIEDSSPTFIDETTFHKPIMKRSHLREGDVLLSIVGTIGGVSLVSLNKYATCSCKLAILRPINTDGFFLSAFLKSKYGQNQVKKFTRGAIQMGLILEDMDQIMVPKFSLFFQTKIKNIIIEAREKSSIANRLYSQSENLLLATLSIKDFTLSKDKVNIKNFKESFLSTGRLDAEYFQKKYEEILQEIRQHKNNLLGNVVTIEKSIEPGSEAYSSQGIPFIRVSNLSKYGITNPEIYLDEEEFCNVIMPTKNTILLSKDGTVGIAYKVTENIKSITSSAILHLKIKTNEVLPDYLTLVLNSIIVQMQAERDAGGSILQHWKPSEIAEVEIPIVEMDIQERISILVQESFILKKQSEDLLELAKRAVEVAIEEGEEAGMRLIEEYEINLNL